MGYKLRALFFSRLETTSHFSKSGAIAATAMGMGGIRWGNIISCTLGTTSAKKANSAVLKISKAKKQGRMSQGMPSALVEIHSLMIH